MAKKGQKLTFIENFALSGAAAVISKTAAAPIERVKLLVQNQSEMLKQGRIDKPYSGIVDCTTRTFKSEGMIFFYYLRHIKFFSSLMFVYDCRHTRFLAW